MMRGDGAGDAVGEAQPGPGLRACLEAILLVAVAIIRCNWLHRDSAYGTVAHEWDSQLLWP